MKVLLGGLGDDAHSVGIFLIKIALEECGFQVTFLGIQNDLEVFMKEAPFHNVIFMSSLNGHSELYLTDFEKQRRELEVKDKTKKIWYLGGNLSVSKSPFEIEKHFILKGFTRVFPKPVDLDVIIESLKVDIIKYNIKNDKSNAEEKKLANSCLSEDYIAMNELRLTEEEFNKKRKEILEIWPTGKNVSDELSVKNLKLAGNLSEVLWKNKINGKIPLIQPRTGVAELHKQIELIKKLYSFGIDISSVQLDAASRRNFYSHTQKGLEDSLSYEQSCLNGFPVPIHGVEGVNKLVNSLPIPFQIRGGAPDHRFAYEIALAGGTTGLEGGFICYLFPYEKNVSPYESFLNWQYIDMLASKFLRQHNILINREFFGPLTSTLIEPSIPIVINIVQSIVAALHGIKSISVGYAEQGNRWQDIAAMNVMEQLVNSYLRKYGFADCQVTTVYHQYMAAFPKNEIKSEELITESSITAALSKATKVMSKTPVEAFKIPSAEDNIRGIKLTRKGFLMSFNASANNLEVEKEMNLIKKEVISIMNVIEELGDKNLVKGIIKAFEKGVIDIPFSPNKYNCGKVVTVRGVDGAIRFADCGNMPFSEPIKKFHHEELVKRIVTERENKISKMVEKDLQRISKGDFKSWPLNTSYLN